MFHKIKRVFAVPGHSIIVTFEDGTDKEYDLNPLIERNEKFKKLKDKELFYKAHIDVDKCRVVWDDTLDISSEEIWDNGEIMKTYTIDELKEELGLDLDE